MWRGFGTDCDNRLVPVVHKVLTSSKKIDSCVNAGKWFTLLHRFIAPKVQIGIKREMKDGRNLSQ